MNMQKVILTCLSCLSILTGCHHGLHPYQPMIQQGNIITPVMIQQVKIGMSKTEVINILGDPILNQSFNNNHWAYVYTLQNNDGPITRKNIDIYFQNDHVAHIAHVDSLTN